MARELQNSVPCSNSSLSKTAKSQFVCCKVRNRRKVVSSSAKSLSSPLCSSRYEKAGRKFNRSVLGLPLVRPSLAAKFSPTRPYVEAAAFRRGSQVIICATLVGVEGSTSIKDLLHAPLQREEKLVTGQLENGFRYVILPNTLPPERFEAHLEVHAGSVDEREHEQGVAHLVEHVTFLGSAKREALLGTGARANAYTDFHHTVFHVHAPLKSSVTGQNMLTQVLEALEEIAFRPQFLPTRIEKERKAVLAEAQMMNTIEYRVDCQLLTYLHHENALGYRFPIGKTEQVKQWPHETLHGFWERWYFPANVTLYVVGDLDRPPSEVEAIIKKTFGHLPAHGLSVSAVKESFGSFGSKSLNGSNGSNGTALLPPRQRHDVRPPVDHIMGCGPLEPNFSPAPVSIFKHPLLQHFQLSVFCKLPIQQMTRVEHLRTSLATRILLSVSQFRMNQRYQESMGAAPFLAIELDISDSGREGCAVSTLTITSEPNTWRQAVEIGVQEIRRLQQHGITQGEFERYTRAVMRDSAQLAEQANKIPSVDTLNFVMESLACAHTVMGHKDAHEALLQAMRVMTVDDVNKVARSALTFVSHYGREGEILAEAAENPDQYTDMGPTRATSIVACIPAYIDASGHSISSGAAPPRRTPELMGAAGHLDADAIDLSELEAQSLAAEALEVPEGAVSWDVSGGEIAVALNDNSLEVTALEDVQQPEALVSEEELAVLIDKTQPHFTPLDGKSGNTQPLPDRFSGVVQRRLSNGMVLNYRHTDNEPGAGLLRVIANGGRASERREIGPQGFGAIHVGIRTLSEAGTVGSWERPQVEGFCIANLINCMVDADEENILMDFHFVVAEGGMEATFQLAHLFLTRPVWSESALERAKQAFISMARSSDKSLEQGCSDRMLAAMFGPTRPFRQPTPKEIEALTLESVRDAVQGLLTPDNIELNVVGDFNFDMLEANILRYFGTVTPLSTPAPIIWEPLPHLNPPPEERHQSWHLKDSDERAAAYIAGKAPCRWGPYGSTDPLPPLELPVIPPIWPLPPRPSPEVIAEAARLRQKHPLYSGTTLQILQEIINSRLFTTVRDSLGLTYDVSFEVTMYDRIRTGWFSVHVTSHPDKIYNALNASVAVLREVKFSPFNRRELERAKTTLITKHESEMKDNLYCLGLITHLQNAHVPFKNIECLRDLRAMYESCTLEDVNEAYRQFQFDDDNIFTVVGTSGKEAPPIPERTLQGMQLYDMAEDEEEMEMEPEMEQLQQVNPMALFTAMMAAAQSVKLSSAFKKIQEDGEEQDLQ